MDYMERIGFGNQPFLVYQHLDTNHPHLHILTTTIRPSGKPIYLHNLGKLKSEPARKALEIEYNLVKAEGRKQTAYLGASTKISNVVSRIVNEYKFASLDELNAILRQFNVMADRGTSDSLRYQKGGLVYSQIDKEGYKTGKAIKASAIYQRPTLAVLRRKFQKNEASKIFFQKGVQNKVLSALSQATSSFEFEKLLKDKDMACSVQYGPKNEMTSLSFVDHVSKTVFDSKDLGLTIPGILEKLDYQQNLATLENNSVSLEHANLFSDNHSSTDYPFTILKTLLSSDQYQPEISPEFFKKKKKRRKQR